MGEFSSQQSSAERAALTAACVAGAVRVAVCSDGMSRGVDLPNVTCVVNYDAAPLARTYVHRVGRTARAGRGGVAVTLLKGGQEKQFHAMRASLAGGAGLERVRVPPGECDARRGAYAGALKALAQVLRAEARGELRPCDDVERLDTRRGNDVSAKTEGGAGGDDGDDQGGALDSESDDGLLGK